MTGHILGMDLSGGVHWVYLRGMKLGAGGYIGSPLH